MPNHVSTRGVEQRKLNVTLQKAAAVVDGLVLRKQHGAVDVPLFDRALDASHQARERRVNVTHTWTDVGGEIAKACSGSEVRIVRMRCTQGDRRIAHRAAGVAHRAADARRCGIRNRLVLVQVDFGVALQGVGQLQRAATEEVDRFLRWLNLNVLLRTVDQAAPARLKERRHRVAIGVAISVVARIALRMVGKVRAQRARLGAGETVQRIHAATVEVVEAAIRSAHIAVDGTSGRILARNGTGPAQRFLRTESEVAQIGTADLLAAGTVPVVDFAFLGDLEVQKDVVLVLVDVTEAGRNGAALLDAVAIAGAAIRCLQHHALEVFLQDDVDDAGDGIGAVDRRAAVLQDFDSFHRFERDHVQVGEDLLAVVSQAVRRHPATVHEHQGRGSAEATQRDARGTRREAVAEGRGH